MCLLNIVEENDATGVVKAMYDEIKGMFGTVPAGLKMWSLLPDGLQHHWEVIKTSFAKDMETQKFETVLRYLVSEAKACEYCLGFNAGMLINNFGMTHDEVILMAKEPKTAPLNDTQKTMLLFALKVANEPNEVNSDDIEALRAQGMSDKAIFELAHQTTHLVMADALLSVFKVQD
ncbi:MAG: hypothetical protein PHV62_06415 [Sulfuricurvum sp.]|nr:hypothetical protein [Sulfuricurvum sp.]